MAQDDLRDDELIGRVAAGDAEAFAALFRRRQGQIYRFALHMTASASIAEDVTQEVFLAVISDAARYDATRASVAAWLCGIARNHVRRRAERDRLLQPLASRFGDEGDDGDRIEDRLAIEPQALGDLTRAESIESLRQAVLTLPVRYREAVVLCDLQELSYADAAVALGCALGTVRSRLHRGRSLLAAKLAASAEAKATAPERPRDGSGNLPDVTRTTRTLRSVRNLA
jgi:RNA polymerase sigma-70 factor (ECF subfamily)